jgi:hypothetical protein
MSTTVIDPFVGSGTAVLAAGRLGAPSFGVDINPFAALLARVRVCRAIDFDRVDRLLQLPSTEGAPKNNNSFLEQADLGIARSIIDGMSKEMGVAQLALWKRVIEEDDTDIEAVTLLSLALAARSASKLEKGSNPTWYRPASETVRPQADFRELGRQWAKRICDDLERSPYTGTRPVLRNENVAEYKCPPFDVCMTSPPYANRLDYAMSHRPELAILEMIVPFVFEDLRRAMIGTTKIIDKSDQIESILGSLCRSLLAEIKTHHSYASERYYFYVFRNYFIRLQAALENILAAMKRGGRGVIVIQDSYYKDVRVDTAAIVIEMLTAMNCSAREAKFFAVRTHMGRLSPAQMSHTPDKLLKESIVYFENSVK